MQVLVLNSGSSSIKYRLFEDHVDGLLLRARGLVERIGESTGRAEQVVIAQDGTTSEEVDDAPIPDHAAGFRWIVSRLEDAGLADDLGAIGHRVVHGGSEFTAPTVIDEAVIARIEDQVPLAPLHNPANLTGIEVARELRPDLTNVAVFDTAFHGTLPPAAYRYAVPDRLLAEQGVRRYGFHGTSHAYVARRAAAALGRPEEELKLVTLHLGNGASAAAVDGGRSVETSMGLSPLEGLVMGTRSGDLDPAVIFHLIREAGMSPAEVERVLNRESGLLGLCGDNDLRTIEERAAGGDEAAQLALDVYVHRIRKYLGAYAAVLGRLDAVVFTAGVGENSDTLRAAICADLEVLGVRLDAARNDGLRASKAPDGIAAVHADDSEVAVLVVATDEEREIAEQTLLAVRS
ncbi:MAG: acetate kinase [Nitriliruptor sp.]|nr:MAG: acetate kinase [Nitriliruptor sp.]